MTHYLVTAYPKTTKADELQGRLARDEFVGMQPFGQSLIKSLRGARLRNSGDGVIGRSSSKTISSGGWTMTASKPPRVAGASITYGRF